jgi:hypothetical protein
MIPQKKNILYVENVKYTISFITQPNATTEIDGE